MSNNDELNHKGQSYQEVVNKQKESLVIIFRIKNILTFSSHNYYKTSSH